MARNLTIKEKASEGPPVPERSPVTKKLQEKLYGIFFVSVFGGLEGLPVVDTLGWA